MGRTMLSKSLIQFSVEGWGCVPSLLFDLRPNYGGGDEDNVTSFERSHAGTAALSAPNPAAGYHWPTLAHTSARDSWTLAGKSGPVSCGVTAPFSWVLVLKVLFVPSKRLFPQSCVCSGSSIVGLMATSFKRACAVPRSAASEPLPLRPATADPDLRRRH
ncbi:unnamed protein product [Rangifer tarandus platyrhynchus]|uniref:Uncharacterized protein n=1 Tax=Rangifer tarandus platyrhynchus TaxID=3082113 RepID=A0AC59ZI93_RANTA